MPYTVNGSVDIDALNKLLTNIGHSEDCLSEKEQLEFYLSHLSEEYKVLSEKIENLHEKDGQINRMILGAKPIDDGIWNGGIGGHDKYAFLGNQMDWVTWR